MGGSSLDTLQQTAYDSKGNLYVLGKTRSRDFPTTRLYGVRATGSDSDLFVAKIRTSDWSLVFSTMIGTALPDALTVDRAGNVYLVGAAASQSFPATVNAFRKTSASDWSLFAAKLAADGSLVYATVLSTASSGSAIAVDDAGYAYIAAGAPADPSAGEVPAPPVASLGGTERSVYLVKLKPDGSSLLFASAVPPMVNAIAVDAARAIYLGGRASSSVGDFHATPGALQTDVIGSGDAFVMKVRPSGDSVEFATLLGGAGDDWVNFLHVDTDGAIFLAGACEYGSYANPAKPFPTTEGAPYRNFTESRGFFAKIDPAASRLLFSTYISESAEKPTSWAVTPTGFHLARPETVRQSFGGLNDYLTADSNGVRVFSFNREGQRLRDPFFVPGLPAGVIAGNDTEVILAGSSAIFGAPLPSSLPSIGPAKKDVDRGVSVQENIALVKCLLQGDPSSVIEADRGYVRLRTPFLGGEPDWQLELTSPMGAAPFRLYPLPAFFCCDASHPFEMDPIEGTTPARINIRGRLTRPTHLLIAYPGGPASMQMIPMLSEALQVLIGANRVVSLHARASGEPVEGDIELKATVTDGSTFESFPATGPFTVSPTNIPSWLTVTPMSGTAPATLHVRAEVKDVQPGKSELAVLNVIGTSNRVSISLIVSREVEVANPGWGLPEGMSFSMPRGGPTPIFRAAFLAPAGLAFQVATSSPRLRVSPMSGAGPVTFEVTLDPAAFDIGTFTESFRIQTDSGVATVECTIRVSTPLPTPVPAIEHYFSAIRGPGAPSPGVRVLVSVSNLSLPDERWVDVSPAPQTWHGLSFRYGSANLPIVASYGDGQFAVQFPYDLKTDIRPLTVDLVSDSEGVLASGTIRGTTLSASVGLVDLREALVYNAGGTPVTADHPVRQGEHIFMSVVGAGKTEPAVPAGELPLDGVVAIPKIPVKVFISGKPANVVRQALSPTRIGVTDLEIEIPLLYSGKHMLGIGDSGVYAVPVYVQN